MVANGELQLLIMIQQKLRHNNPTAYIKFHKDNMLIHRKFRRQFQCVLRVSDHLLTT